MEDEALERLKRLQMEDLGTLRREYISTVDTKKFKNIRLQDIEATRMVNVAGSDAARLAKANQERLNAWTNAHKDLRDPADEEPLDPLLNGQSHRLGLRAVIEGSGGQSYSKANKKNDSFLQVAPRAPSGRYASRGSNGRGRGGGVIGTRGRETTQTSLNAHTRVTHQGAVAKLGNHVVHSPQARKPLQDPALDINNEAMKKTRGVSGSKSQPFVRGGVKTDLVHLKTRRPVSNTDWSRVLSPPEDFLSIARGRLLNTTAPNVATAVDVRSSEQTEVTVSQRESRAVDHESAQSINQPQETNAGRAYEDSIVSLCSDGDSIAIATPVSSNNGQTSQVSIAQAALTASGKDQRSEPARLQSPPQQKPQQQKPQQQKPQQEKPQQQKPQQEKPQQEKPQQEKPQQEKPQQEKPQQEKPQQEKLQQEKLQQEKPQQEKPQQVEPTPGKSDGKAQVGKQNQEDELVDVSTPPSGSTPIVQSKDLYAANFQTERRTGILLDFNSTPPRKSLPGAEDSSSMSPALQDLEGINFQASVAKSVLSRPETQIYSFIKPERVDSKDSTRPRIAESTDDTTTSTADDTPSDLAVLREKLARLCKFVEETLRQHVPEPLRDMDLQALKKYEQELKEILSLHQQTVKETVSQTGEKQQRVLSSQKPQGTEAETTVEGENSKLWPPTPSVCSPLARTPLEEGNSRLSLRSEDTVSPGKFNAQAKEFVPTGPARNSSFSGWRDTKPSPPSSTTSESPTGQSQHSRQNSQDHRPIDSSSSYVPRIASQASQRGRQASENHIFGDHLLPGRSKPLFGDHLLPGRSKPLFGDHLLPGRGKPHVKTHGSEAVSQDKNALHEPNDSRSKCSTPAKLQSFTVPRARPSAPESINNTGETSPRPAGLATTAPGTGSNGVKPTSGSGPSTPTPVPKAVKAVYRAMSKGALSQVNALQRSTHAPKAQENPTAMRNPSTSALGGPGGSISATPAVQKPTVAAPQNRKSSSLGASRWASSETQKPLR